jgi:putative drug exporter of the RND superfamily
LVVRRRKAVIALWILALVAAVPVALQVGNVTSLQQGTATGSQLESVLAANIISSQFQRSVPNSTLLVVVSSQNVSSPETQGFLRDLLHSLRSNDSLTAMVQSVDVYESLYSTIGGLNEGGLTTLAAANASARLLFGVPALYLHFWNQSYLASGNETQADAYALQSASAVLSQENETAFNLYSSPLLDRFNDAWASLSGQGEFLARADAAEVAAGTSYAKSLPPTQASFDTAVLKSLTLSGYLTASGQGWSADLTQFAAGYVSRSTGFSDNLVSAAISLGPRYSNQSLDALAGNLVSNPRQLGEDPTLSSLISSLVSPGRDTTLVSLGFNDTSDANLQVVRGVVSQTLARYSSSGALTAQVTGESAISHDFGSSTQADLGLILPVTIALLIIATGWFFRSALTPFLTLGTIGVALGISQVFVVIVGTYVAKVDFTIPTILLTVLIGVGTDYSVFVIARYREERVNGLPVDESVRTSVTWAGESIATSGATVVISFLSLALTSVVFLKTMGIAVGLGVLVALAAALTLVPALLAQIGGRAFWPNSGRRFEGYASAVKAKLQRRSGYFSRSGAFAVKRAKPLIVLAIVVTLPAVYVYSTTVPTYDFLSAAPGGLESVAASNHLASSFGGGRLFPSYVVVVFESPLISSGEWNGTEVATLATMTLALRGDPGVQNVTGPTSPFGSPVNPALLNLTSPSDSRAYSRALTYVSEDGKTALVTLNFKTDPYSSTALDEAGQIRQQIHSDYGPATGVSAVYLGGASGSILDTKTVFDSQFASVVPIVAVGVALVLLVVLGSLFLPVFAVLSVLMSIVWTLAATKLVFQQFFNYQILFITPFFLFVTLLGLGMDYNVFILTRIREEATKGRPLDEAIVGAIEQTGGIITAAAIILAGSLGALMLSGDLLLKQLGFAFAYSILIDALIVRTYLVPAVMSTMGKWNWYCPVPGLSRSRALFERKDPPAA